MTTIKTLISTAALFAVATVFAQSGSKCVLFPKGDEYGQGNIGKRYAEAGLSIQNPLGYDDYAYGAGVGVNIPVISHIDVSAGYSYGTLNYTPKGAPIDTAIDSESHSFGGSVTIYNTIENNIKPYVSVNLGHTFAKIDYLDANHDTNYQWWGACVGAEFPYKWFSLNVRVGYDDDFRRPSYSVQDYFAGAQLSAWITSKIGAYADVTYVRPMHSYANSWVFGAGLRVRL